MRKQGIGLALCGAAVAAALLSPSASAATLAGDYQLQATEASSGPGPALTDVGAGAKSFAINTLFGTDRQVLTFPAGSGLQMSPANVGAGFGPYSVVTTFRLGNVSGSGGYARILDGTNGTADDGLYSHDGKIDWYDSGGAGDNESSSPVLADNVYATVAMVTLGLLKPLKMYVDGTQRASFEGYPLLTANNLRFFLDDGAENSSGAVSCIRVYDGALTDAEVAGIGSSPTCQAPPSPPTTTARKCKKHKKPRSAESAKKKCKKRKKH